MLQLKKFPDILVSTPEEARESRPHPEEPVSISYLERRDTFPACSGKNSRRSRRISRGGTLHRKGERNSRVVPPFPQSPRCLSLFQGNLFSLHCLDFQAEDRFTPRWHLGEPCGKASCESLMGKPRAKVTDPLIHAKGSVALCYSSGGKRPCKPSLETRTDFPGETPEVPQDPCRHWRGIRRFRH